MTEMLDADWKVSEDAVANSVGDETVILHLVNSNYYGLDTIGTVLWEGIDAGKRPSEICDAVVERYDVGREIVEADFARFLADLESNDLIERR